MWHTFSEIRKGTHTFSSPFSLELTRKIRENRGFSRTLVLDGPRAGHCKPGHAALLGGLSLLPCWKTHPKLLQEAPPGFASRALCDLLRRVQ